MMLFDFSLIDDLKKNPTQMCFGGSFCLQYTEYPTKRQGHVSNVYSRPVAAH